MNILIIDTSTEACSVALQFDDSQYYRYEICPQQHSQRLLPMVDEVLVEAGIKLQQLDYLGFGRGPGSFTGVRIATGMIQGLALGTDLSVVGLSTLAAMAQQAYQLHDAKEVIAATDARMDEVYIGHYQLQNGVMVLTGEEQVLPPDDAVTQIILPALNGNSKLAGVGTGWQAYPELMLQHRLQFCSDILYPDARYMLKLAQQAIEQGQALEVDQIQPVYLRDKVTWKKLPGRDK
ncbi:tRNA (adenosine(37)-N6)-threonylcarbamoyltransferase complex dimerization subunit type 1 TsaB [Neptunicella sp. SCSIO 80796]|uniref:tRNA (adenosine(37)-N6)-threonylcarbamoyltransferase complex dimerization subunit type 1 TsaB n=1 Tax=Neptunicella plasticusilytica TaxID=3117012 RepID=UPI003A4E38DD